MSYRSERLYEIIGVLKMVYFFDEVCSHYSEVPKLYYYHEIDDDHISHDEIKISEI